MPVKYTNSAVLKWPDRQRILESATIWAEKIGQTDKAVISIRCFGSIASDRWGVGSDLDILIELESSSKPFMERSLDYTPLNIDVPVEILVYTTKELSDMEKQGYRFIKELKKNAIVLYSRNDTTLYS